MGQKSTLLAICEYVNGDLKYCYCAFCRKLLSTSKLDWTMLRTKPCEKYLTALEMRFTVCTKVSSQLYYELFQVLNLFDVHLPR